MTALAQNQFQVGDSVYVFDGQLLVSGTVQDVGSLIRQNAAAKTSEAFYAVRFDRAFEFDKDVLSFPENAVFHSYEAANKVFRDTFKKDPKKRDNLMKYFRKVGAAPKGHTH
ncbi:MAG: hypothetical protein WAO98_01810 [Alphaproteobacteria bacterium]